MPPKKAASSKSIKGQDKAVEKAKQKAAEDKTFGLKNKNKSKAVQKYIKTVQSQVKGNQVSEAALRAKEQAQKEEKKKLAQQQALIASLFKGTENAKKAAEAAAKQTPETIKAGQAIDLYVDHRKQRGHEDDLANVTTDQICKHFFDAVEKRQYGWFWECPNGGDKCIYRHCLPEGYVLKDDTPIETVEDEETIEERVERQRAELVGEGTKVTYETFMAWKKRKEEERLANVEAQRVAESKKTGGKGYGVLSGRDLFTYDPALFVDDAAAAGEADYEEDPEYWDSILNANQQAVDKANQEALAGSEKGDPSKQTDVLSNDRPGSSQPDSGRPQSGQSQKDQPQNVQPQNAQPQNVSLFLDDEIDDVDIDDL